MRSLWMVLLAFTVVGCSEPLDDEMIVIDTEEQNGKSDRGDREEEESQCAALVCGAQCGEISNECGDVVDCGTCIDEERLEELGGWVDDYVQQILDQSFPRSVGDYDAELLAREVREILSENQASDAGFIAALRHALLESRIGHAAIYEGQSYTCTGIDGAGDGGVSRHGACAVSHSEGMLVTDTVPGNALELEPGDLVVAANGISGDGLVEWSLQQPVCGGGAASGQARKEEAARSFFSALPAGTVLTIESPDGSRREVEISSSEATDWLYCRDPLGRSTRHVAKAELRDDGVAVIHLPGFTPVGGFDQNRDPWEQMAELTDDIHAVFESVRGDATAIAWDVRANVGGASPVGFSIAGGFPGAQQVAIARCTTRVPFSDPPEFHHAGPDYDLEVNEDFAFDGPVAILTDGRTLSAGDYFARAVSLGTDALIVGTPTSGAYGGSGATFPIAGEHNLLGAYDPYRCNDVDGEPLETRGVQPDVVVEYDPADIAAGVDTVLERAADELLR